MAKFSDIALGPLARRSVEFPLPSGRVITVDVVPLFGESEATILKEARAFAQARGVPDPKNGDPLYELGLWVHTIALGVVDPESPQDAPKPFFDGGVSQILDERTGLGREWIALLFEAQQAWQDELAPRPKEMGAVEYFKAIIDITQSPRGSELPFFRWRRALQADFLRTLCGTLFEAPQVKSLLGALSSESSPTLKSDAPPMTNDAPVKAEA